MSARTLQPHERAPENTSRTSSGRRLSRREHAVLALVVRGESNKCIAHELRLSRSSVSTYLARVRRKLAAPHRIHLISANAANASSVSDVTLPGERTDEASLTAAERAVVAAILAGKSNREIGVQRRTSPHTVANQIAAIFQKLGVGCRSELAARLHRTATGVWRSST